MFLLNSLIVCIHIQDKAIVLLESIYCVFVYVVICVLPHLRFSLNVFRKDKSKTQSSLGMQMSCLLCEGRNASSSIT